MSKSIEEKASALPTLLLVVALLFEEEAGGREGLTRDGDSVVVGIDGDETPAATPLPFAVFAAPSVVPPELFIGAPAAPRSEEELLLPPGERERPASPARGSPAGAIFPPLFIFSSRF